MNITFKFAVAALATLSAAPSFAQAGYYRATLTTAAAKPTMVTRDTVWHCADTVCTAGKAGARDAIVCELVAQRAGALAGFMAGGNAFAADALAKCNARAK